MRRCLFVVFVLFLSTQTLDAKIYECTYKTKNNVKVVSSFNTLNVGSSNYSELSAALRSGNCKELYVKKYFIDATSCNIQFYKSNMQIANITCSKNNQTALKKLKDIARRDFNYRGL